MLDTLNVRQKLAYSAHLFKALTKQRFLDLVPMLKTYINDDSVIIDVGANAGHFSKLFSKLAPNGQVYAFEPGSYARSILTRVIYFRRLRNVNLFPFGLSDTACENILHMPIKAKGNLGIGLSHLGYQKSVDGRDTKSETIQLSTLDAFVADLDLKRVDFIKCDTEGWELRMLTGAEKTIATFRPVLMLEVVNNFLGRAGDSSAALWDFLNRHNYEVIAFDDKGRMTPAPEAIMLGDIICLPK